jgi:hypothetical protein
MPITLNSRMIAIFDSSSPVSRKYTTITVPMNPSSTSSSLPCWTM